MKKVMAVVAVTLLLGVSKGWAGPYTPNVAGDTYDSTPDAVSTPAMKQDNGGTANNDIYDAVNVLLGTSHTKNEQVDNLQYLGADNVWQDVGAPGNPGTFNIIGVGAGYTDTLKVYDVTTPGTKIDVFGGGFTGYGITGDGTVVNPFPSTTSPFSFGTQFGWSLEANGAAWGDPTFNWDSDPSKNADGYDHMITYHLAALTGKTVYLQDTKTDVISKYTFNDPYLLTWEDKGYNGVKLGDEDYNDLIVVVDRVVPVPEPMTMSLFATGLLGAGFMRMRRKSAIV